MATALIIAGVVAAGATAYGAAASSSAAKKGIANQTAIAQQNAAAQEKMLAEYMAFMGENIEGFREMGYELVGENKGIIEDTYNRIAGIIERIPSISELVPEAKLLSREDFDFRTGIKRENLAYILGETEDDLRSAQEMQAGLASLDPTRFTNRINDIIKSDMLGLKALTVGEPTGSFANISTANLYNMSERGLSSFLAINDFFSREGTVDPISPIQLSFDLRRVEESEAGMRIGNERYRADSLVDSNNALLGIEREVLAQNSALGQTALGFGSNTQNALSNNLINLSTADVARKNAETQGYVNAVNTLVGAVGGAYGLGTTAGASGAQSNLFSSLIGSYMGGGGASRNSIPGKYNYDGYTQYNGQTVGYARALAA